MARAAQGESWGRTLRLVIEGEGEARRLTLPTSGVISIGRDAASEVVLASPQVSRHHLSLFVTRGVLYVRDHSAYGTRVDGLVLHMAVRRAASPARLQLGPYRIEVSLHGFWAAAFARLARMRAREAALVAAAGLALFAAAKHPKRQPPVAAAACAAEEEAAAPPSAAALAALGEVSTLHAVQLLRAGRKREALALYRALGAQPDSPAPLGIVASLLAYELSCPR